jgi:PAS domain S-box-containing protein
LSHPSLRRQDDIGHALAAAVLDAGPDAISLVDVDGTVTRINPAGLRMLGFSTAADVVGHTLFELAHRACHDEVRAGLRAAAHGELICLRTRSRPINGEERWYDSALYPLNQERPSLIVMTCRDVTEERYKDIELRGQAGIMQAVAAGAPLADILRDACLLAEQLLPGCRCSVLRHDEASATLHSAAAPNLPQSFLDLTDGMPVAAGSAVCGHAVATGETTIVADMLAEPRLAKFHAAAAAHQLAACCSVPLVAGGRVLGALAYYNKVARGPSGRELERVGVAAGLAALALEQNRVREARATSDARFRLAAEAVPGIMFVADRHGNNIYVNPYFRAVTGLDDAALQGDHWLDVVHGDDRAHVSAAWSEALANGCLAETRCRMRMADGSYRWYLGRGLPQRAADGTITGYVGVAVDIDELINGRELLQRYRTELEALVDERTKALSETATELQAEMARREQAMAALAHSHKVDALGQLTGGVAHDFNNLLAAIMGSFQLIERRTHEQSVVKLARNGLHASERAASLVRQLLAVARREPPRPEWLDLSVALPNMQDLLRHALNPRISLRVDVPRDTWPVFIDAPQLETALLNLAVNARDAMPAGGSLTISATNCAQGAQKPGHVRDRDSVVITVADTGVGIAPELLDRVFEPFFTTKPRGEGTGLGLAMVRTFAQHAAGDIHVDSATGEGTRISLYLPRAAANTLPRPATPAENTAGRGNATVLVVDDDEAVRAITAAFLREAGYQVLEAGSGAVALALLQVSGPVELLVTDLAMPAMDGMQLANAVRAARPGLPVVFVTGYPDDHDLSAEVVVQKPFGTGDLTNAVARALGHAAERAPRVDHFVGQMHSRLTQEAYLTWQALRAGDGLPRFGALTVAGRAWAENAVLLSVDSGRSPPSFRWVSVGQALARYLPLNGSGRPVVSAETLELLRPLEQACRACLADGKPHYDMLSIGAGGLQGEQLMLPVTSEAGGVTHLLGIITLAPAAALAVAE